MTEANESPTLALLSDDALSTDERLRALLPLVYGELRALAQRMMAGEHKGHTLQATALAHEAFMRLVGPREIPWQNRAHFFSAAAEAMRRILIDHARVKGAAKRGGRQARRAALDLSTLPDPTSETEAAGFLILDEALARLETVDPAAAEIVRLRYFAGLSVEDVAAMLDVSSPTVKRSWAFARAWLREFIETERS